MPALIHMDGQGMPEPSGDDWEAGKSPAGLLRWRERRPAEGLEWLVEANLFSVRCLQSLWHGDLRHFAAAPPCNSDTGSIIFPAHHRIIGDSAADWQPGGSLGFWNLKRPWHLRVTRGLLYFAVYLLPSSAR